MNDVAMETNGAIQMALKGMITAVKEWLEGLRDRQADRQNGRIETEQRQTLQITTVLGCSPLILYDCPYDQGDYPRKKSKEERFDKTASVQE